MERLLPPGLLALLQRRGRYRAEDFARLHLVAPFDLSAAKARWLTALDDADRYRIERELSGGGICDVR